MWKTDFIKEERPGVFSEKICAYKNAYKDCEITILKNNEAYIIYKEVSNGRKATKSSVEKSSDSGNEVVRKPRKARK